MPNHGDYLAYRLRDGVLQDVVAISLLIVGARQALRDGAERGDVDALLVRAQHVANADLDEIRAVIDDLRAVA